MIEESLLTSLIPVLVGTIKLIGRKVSQKRKNAGARDLALNLSLDKLTIGNFSLDNLNLELKRKN